ncbi:MAG: ATP-binding protein [Bacteroidota bacterium]|nr:ATP-binding protein [Bacteroidota bacterium]
MTTQQIIPRQSEQLLAELIPHSPVVLIHGPRQSGKTTLAKLIGDRLGYSYYTFDNLKTLAAVQSDPTGFMYALPDRVILDEIQLAPELFRLLKLSVDRHRINGQFILTGSTNVLFLPELTDALTGRMLIVRLHPLSQVEIEQTKSTPFLERLFTGDFRMSQSEPLGSNLADRIVAGGYPPALAIPVDRIRSSWYNSYVVSLIQHDITGQVKVHSPESLPSLITAVAGLSAQLFNASSIASQLQMNRNTIRHYLSLLERHFLIKRLPPWYSNRMKRMIKTPKIHIGDTGLACSLLNIDANDLQKDRNLLGQLLESFVFQELRRQASSSSKPYRFYHFRDRYGVEADMIIELGGSKLAGVEIKAGASITSSDFKALRKIKAAHEDRFTFGALLYDGELCASFGDGMFAVPIRMLWETDSKP